MFIFKLTSLAIGILFHCQQRNKWKTKKKSLKMKKEKIYYFSFIKKDLRKT